MITVSGKIHFLPCLLQVFNIKTNFNLDSRFLFLKVIEFFSFVCYKTIEITFPCCFVFAEQRVYSVDNQSIVF